MLRGRSTLTILAVCGIIFAISGSAIAAPDNHYGVIGGSVDKALTPAPVGGVLGGATSPLVGQTAQAKRSRIVCSAVTFVLLRGAVAGCPPEVERASNALVKRLILPGIKRCAVGGSLGALIDLASSAAANRRLDYKDVRKLAARSKKGAVAGCLTGVFQPWFDWAIKNGW